MKGDAPRLVALSLAAGLLGAAGFGAAQSGLEAALAQPEAGAPGTPAELGAWAHVRENDLIAAREAAEAVLRAEPKSYLGHFVLGWALHYAEASFPRALHHQRQAWELFVAAHGEDPVAPGFPWRWHARMILERAELHGDLEQHEERLAWFARYDEHYTPKTGARNAWPLMKLGRYEEARRAAAAGIGSGDEGQLELGLNAFCAIEFEAGNDGASYDACKAALDQARTTPAGPSTVDYTNFAEGALSLFRFAEAERSLLAATEAQVSWFGNPWLMLSELYIRGGRLPEALTALKEVPGYRMRRPPHVRDSDRNEHRRALASLMLTAGRPAEALAITEKARVAPDRRGHNSRDPLQDDAIVALLDRAARLSLAEALREEAVGEGLGTRLLARLEARWLRFEAWLGGRSALRAIGDDAHLVGIHRIGTAAAAIVPPWLLGDLASLAGPGVTREALRRARALDRREGAGAYYDAFGADAALEAGDEARAIELADRARRGLGDGDGMLRARASALLAEATRRSRGVAAALPAYDATFQVDPGAFRRLGFAVPVRLTTRGDAIAEDVADALRRSPRFDVAEEGLAMVVNATAAGGTVCLRGGDGSELACAEVRPTTDDDPASLAARLAAEAHRVLFAPAIDLTQADIGSLDGTNVRRRGDLDTLLEQGTP
ncbi:MAG: hypothetical protein AAGH15_14745 [Myxococcota bacterium]